MKIALIGMPNTGKTYWSKKLEAAGWRRFGCDDLIGAKLGVSGINSVAGWMGQPFMSGYAAASKKYLELEKKAMKEIFTELNQCRNENAVIDTTGSVIYLGSRILKKLKRSVKVVYLDTPAAVKKEMYRRFLKYPKPIIWGKVFAQRAGEPGRKELARCYPKLLKSRTKQYEKLAVVTIDYYRLRDKLYSVEQLLNDIL